MKPTIKKYQHLLIKSQKKKLKMLTMRKAMLIILKVIKQKIKTKKLQMKNLKFFQPTIKWLK